MSSQDATTKRKVSKKLVKRQAIPERKKSLQYPPGLEPGDDVDDDVTAPKGAPQFMNPNQSVYSLIKAAGSKKDFHARFDDESSSSSSDTEREDAGTNKYTREGASSALPQDEQQRSLDVKKTRGRHADSKLRRSLPKLSIRSKKEKDYMIHSTILPSQVDGQNAQLQHSTPRDAPVMSRMLEAQSMLDEAAEDAVKEVKEEDEMLASQGRNQVGLKERLQEIFGFDSAEEVVSEYPCWLLQSILLQGYMYITEKHIAFYAYLPKKSSVVSKSGYLSKRGKQNPKFNRYWFTLKGDVLSYYADPADLYFPSGNIDLRYGISAALVDSSKDKSKESNFSVTTTQRTYFFKADSAVSAKEWVKNLQKVIFRTHNDGDSVKISLPIENIIDIDESPIIDFADTVKLQVVDNEENLAVDEYFFSFFSFGKDAIDVLRALVEERSDRRPSGDLLRPGAIALQAGGHSGTASPLLRENVRATLSPVIPDIRAGPSPRASGDWGKRSMDSRERKSVDLRAISGSRQPSGSRMSGDWSRRSMDASRELRKSFDFRGRRSESTSRKLDSGSQRPESPYGSRSSKPAQSADSFVHSMDPSTASSTFNAPSDASASQILSRSDMFRSPTINRLAESPDRIQKPRRSETANTASTNENIKVNPPSRSQTQPRQEVWQQQGHGPRNAESGSSIQNMVKGSLPAQKAAGIAGYLRRGSKRMSTLLATESMSYVEKVSGMWAGGRKHYGESVPNAPEPDGEELDDEATTGHGDRFRAHFALPETEKLQATYFGYLYRVLPLYGKIYIGDKHFCFRSLLPGTRTRLILPIAHIENVSKERGFSGLGYHGLVVTIRGFEEIFFEFNKADLRDDCAITLHQSLDTAKYLKESGILSQEDIDSAEAAKEEHKKLQEARKVDHDTHDLKLPQSVDTTDITDNGPPILFDDPRASIINFKPTESLRITCLTIGSRGDVQPYIALCKGFLAEGHKPRIATHVEFEPWVRKHGIDFAPVDGDPAELMRICVENGMFTVSFLREASSKFRGWIDSLLSSAWKACQDTDLLIESPSAMAGIHIAEALSIPYFRAFTMPWTRTRAYPHAFAVPERKMGGSYNLFSYVMFDNVFWQAIAGQVNRWRKKELGLRSTNLDKLHPNKVPFLYNFSPSVVIPPIDYSDWIRVTGYWFLDEADNWTPPEELSAFIKQARDDGKKLVYIGFGSIVVSDPAALTKTVVDSVVKADVRCILSKGWSDRLGTKDSNVPEVPLPSQIHQIASAPHDWLFKQVDAVAHHGGAGTTGASLRAGVPTIIKPFFGDQFFFGSRVEDLGVGICMKKLNTSVFSRALWETTHSERMIVKANILGQQIRSVSFCLAPRSPFH
jgi:sterol 3beta-glucosyltransferase